MRNSRAVYKVLIGGVALMLIVANHYFGAGPARLFQAWVASEFLLVILAGWQLAVIDAAVLLIAARAIQGTWWRELSTAFLLRALILGVLVGVLSFSVAISAFAIQSVDAINTRPLRTLCVLAIAGGSFALPPAILEEALFRGVIFGLAQRYLRNIWVASFVQALLFALAHSAQLLANPIQGIYFFAYALFAAALKFCTGSLSVVIALHWTWNTCLFLCAGWPGIGDPIPGFDPSSLAFMIASVIVFIVGTFLLIVAHRGCPCVLVLRRNAATTNAPRA